jgi:probable phosphoglycerate mutase
VADPVGDGALNRPLIPAGLNATLVLLRHGESVAITEGRFQGRLDTPLSPLGEQQARLAGERLARPERPPHIAVPHSAPIEIAHSPLARAAATAEAAGRALRAVHAGVPGPRPEAGLLEVAQGAWEGLHRLEVEARFRVELDAWRLAPQDHPAPGGEPLIEVDRRVRAALPGIIDRLAAAGPPTDPAHTSAAGYPPPTSSPAWSLLVGHDGVFKVVLLALLDLPLDRFWSFSFGLTGITIVAIHDGTVVLRAHNLMDHLGPLQTASAADDEAADRTANGAL